MVAVQDVGTEPDRGDWFASVFNSDRLTVAGLLRESPSHFYPGKLDELVVYPYVLSLAQIRRHYYAGLDQRHTVSGVVRNGSGEPCARDIVILDRSAKAILEVTSSDAVTGDYQVTVYGDATEIQRIAIHDDTAEGVIRNDLIDRVLPG